LWGRRRLSNCDTKKETSWMLDFGLAVAGTVVQRKVITVTR
jgi:hypothetical protein